MWWEGGRLWRYNSMIFPLPKERDTICSYRYQCRSSSKWWTLSGWINLVPSWFAIGSACSGGGELPLRYICTLQGNLWHWRWRSSLSLLFGIHPVRAPTHQLHASGCVFEFFPSRWNRKFGTRTVEMPFRSFLQYVSLHTRVVPRFFKINNSFVWWISRLSFYPSQVIVWWVIDKKISCFTMFLKFSCYSDVLRSEYGSNQVRVTKCQVLKSIVCHLRHCYLIKFNQLKNSLISLIS